MISFTNKDVNTSIFSQLDPYDRAIICSVSKWFEGESLRVSLLLTSPNNRRVYEYTELSNSQHTTLDEYLGANITKQMYIDIAFDTHLLMRLKYKHRHIFYGVGISGNINAISMMRRISSHELYYMYNGLAYGGHTHLLLDYINNNDSAYIECDYIIYQAAKRWSHRYIK